MKRKTIDRLAMYQGVLAAVKENESKWSSLVGMVDVVDRYETLLAEMKASLAKRDVITSGVSDVKDAFLNDLVRELINAKTALALYAKKTGDLSLLARHNASVSKVKRMKVAQLEVEINNVLVDVQIHAAELEDFALTAAKIQVLMDMAGELEAYKNSTRAAIAKRTLETATVNKKEKLISELIRIELDGLMLLFETTEPEFYLLYKAARKIINYNSGKSVKTKTDLTADDATNPEVDPSA